jgi:23S rRNA pseudouridine1911/1915/1917 synthase
MEFIEFQWLQDELSRKSALQKTLNCSGQLLKKHFSSKELSSPLRAGDVSRLPLDLVNHLQINPTFKGSIPHVIKESSDYLVIHKPPGLHSHPHCYSDQDTLINFLVTIGQWKALNVNQAHYDRGLVYRLDYETSGVMLVAKTNEFHEFMRSDFKLNMKRKIYWVIVEGNFDQEGEWSHYFRKSGSKGAKQKVSVDFHSEADKGTLRVKKIANLGDKSFLMVNLSTGLRHQIRAQLAALGFPILGDILYGGKQAERLFLHAWRYEWNEFIEDNQAELFDRFLDLNSALQMSHDMLGSI